MSNLGDSDPDPGHRFRFKPQLDRPVLEVMDDASLAVQGDTSLDLLQAVYRDPAQPPHRRLRAAIAALPFEHPKLAVTASVGVKDFAAQLEAARKRSGKPTPQLPQPADCGVTDTECPSDVR